MNDQIKFEYIKEHLPYEIEMMRHAHEKLNMGACPADWNAFYQSFAVNARNMYMFLTNEDGSNVKAKNFVKEFKSKKNDLTKAIHYKFLMQVFHLGSIRPINPKNKISLKEINLYFIWICENIERFFELLSGDYRRLWPDQKAAGLSKPSLVPELTHGPTGPPPPHREPKL